MKNLEELKKIHCLGYLMVYVHVESQPLPYASMQTRHAIKTLLEYKGFQALIKGWRIKPIYDKSECKIIKAELQKANYTISAQLTMLFVRKEDFSAIETIEIESEVALMLKDD